MATVARRFRSDDWGGLAGIASVVGAVAILYLARETFIPLAYAITLTLILSPPVAWLQKHGVPRVVGTVLAMIVTITTMLGISYVVTNQLLQVVNELPEYRETIAKKVQAFRRPGQGALGRAAENVKALGKELETPAEAPVTTTPLARGRTAAAGPVPVRVVDPPQSALSNLRDVIEPFIAPLTMLGIVLVFTVFLLIEQSDLRNRLFKLAGVGRLNVMTEAVDDATRRVSRYLLLQFLVNFIFGLLIGVGLWVIGVPYAALWGGVAALLRIVPYVGSVVAALLPLTLCLAVFDSWQQPLMVFALFAVLEVVTGNFLEPWLYGAHTGISSLALLITTIFWATLWGPSGLILSTPLTVCVVVLGRHVKQLSFLHTLFGDEPVLPPDAQLYQRLLAMDDHDARAVVQEYGNERSMIELYDTVLLPALTMAEVDRQHGGLSPEREEFFFLSVREMLAELSEKWGDSLMQPEPRPFEGRILHVPAHDEADELASAMLAQLLDQGRRVSVSFPLGVDLKEMLNLVLPTPADIFCVSSVPPFAFSRARATCSVLRSHSPRTKIMVGVWGFNSDLERAAQRFGPNRPEALVTTFAAALEQIEAAANAPSAPSGAISRA